MIDILETWLWTYSAGDSVFLAIYIALSEET